jgi:AraC-like DNA-binding protein
MNQEPPALIRAASLSGFQELAIACGLQPLQLLRSVGLSTPMLRNGEFLIPLAAVVKVLEMAALQSDTPTFGLRLAASRQPSNLGETGLLLMAQPDLRSALLAASHHGSAINSGLSIQFRESGAVGVMLFDHKVQGHTAPRQTMELIAGVLVRLIRSLVGQDWSPRRVLFSHPPPMDDSLHKAVFDSALEFGSGINAIVIPSEDLARPLATANTQMAELLADQMAGHHIEGLITKQVRLLLMRLMPHGRASIEQVALHLGMTKRTLQRHLQAEGYVFFDMMQASRKAMAKHYLGTTDKSMSEVSDLLGFTHLAAFSRWCNDNLGQPPSRFRKAIKQAETA